MGRFGLASVLPDSRLPDLPIHTRGLPRVTNPPAKGDALENEPSKVLTPAITGARYPAQAALPKAPHSGRGAATQTDFRKAVGLRDPQ